jgi:PhzF family phenazine biosynthesis protein
MPLPMVQVDAFTDTLFAGNPAAVFLLDEPRAADWMQLVAREMNLSETAFLVRRASKDGFNLRWFTPLVEVPLCGHATLASAHVLWEDGHLLLGEQARFHTQSGPLTADRRGDWIELEFPADPVSPIDVTPALQQAIGAPIQSAHRATTRYVVELEDEAAVRSLDPDLGLIAALPIRGVVVTARSAYGTYDFVVRNFIPSAGIPEDPVTGAAQCSLAPFWAARLGKRELLAYQASARGGILRSRLAGDRVRISGQACTVLRGELLTE